MTAMEQLSGPLRDDETVSSRLKDIAHWERYDKVTPEEKWAVLDRFAATLDRAPVHTVPSIGIALGAIRIHGGCLVSSADCSEMEIADARARGDFYVDADGFGFVRRLPEWLRRHSRWTRRATTDCCEGTRDA